MNRLALNVFDELNRMQRDMDRFLVTGRTPRRCAPRSLVSFLPGRAARTRPLINISEDADNIYVDALTPGVDPQSLDISMTGDQLTISGEKKALPKEIASGNVLRNERIGGRFQRSTTLPREVDRERIEASYKSGVLKITLPKAEKAKPKKIQVNIG